MIPFNQLKPLHDYLADEINAALLRVAVSGWYILGPEVAAFEREFAAYHGVRHAVGVATGTDAIELALRAGEVGKGDEVITVAHTALATVAAIEATGAAPVLADIDSETFTLCPDAARAAITRRTRAIVAVHLYGGAADMDSLRALAQKHDLLLIEDCAQAHGALYRGRKLGTLGSLGAFSFYPTKNMGAYGDGGAVITNDDALADKLRKLRNYGQSSRYRHQSRGTNSRLDEMQAAVLRVKLAHLDDLNQRRRDIAAIYEANLTGVRKPGVRADCQHVYHLYVIRDARRDQLMADLQERGIGSLIHYPVPVHLQESHRDLGLGAGSLPHTERAAREILSLPLYIGLRDDAALRVCEAVGHLRGAL
ncbi:MAG: DegT/DnrJ/EryC1/StrS family aminotransferase [Chloroflexi bacterium]|nr:DegT/DnrJ/EryC1/StrS family aminotransferase [Chloroflexota bacterium]MCY4248465.1 DegT/DnrJ/EryC1/StrS family aminotransferase [Chloroflexota bacterium]